MSDEENNNNPLNVRAGWYSEPNVEFVIDSDDEEKGIIEKIKYFFKLLF